MSVALCFIPYCLYRLRRLDPDKAYFIISLFWLINGIVYIPDIFLWSCYSDIISNWITISYNLVDAPLIILFFYFNFKRKFFLYLFSSFILFEMIMIAWKGAYFESNDIIIGVGTLICLVLNIWSISRYFLKIEHTEKEDVLVFAYAGYIFYYGLFSVVYIFNYLHFSKVTLPYVMFINYSAICIATSLTIYGFWKNTETQYKEEKY